MRTIIFCLIFLISTPSAFCQERWEIYADINSFSYCEPYTIYGVFNDLEGDFREGGDLAFTFDRAELGARKGNWQISIFHRYDYYIEATPDLTLFYYQKERDLPLNTNYLYHGALSASHLYASGLSFAYTWRITDSFWLKPRINLIRGTDFLDGDLRGELLTDAERSYQATAVVDYFYSEDILFDRKVKGPTGNGVSLDLHAKLSLLPNMDIEILIADLWSKIRWEDAPHTKAQGDTDTVLITDEGYLKSKALLSGIESNVDFDQDLPSRALINAKLHLKNSDALIAELFMIQSFIMPRLGYAWHFSDQYNIALLYDFKGDALGIRLKFMQFYAGLIADSLNRNKAHTFGFSLGYTYQF